MNPGQIDAMDALRQGKSFVLVGHVHPDGDSIGSVLALGLALERLGKRVWWVSDTPIPAMYTFLPGCDRFIDSLPDEAGEAVLVALDCADRGRLALDCEREVDLNIDHHASNTHFARVNLIDGEAAATGEIIAGLIDALGVPVSDEIAPSLYVAVATDTGFFRFSNTSAATLALAGRLAATGVDPGRLAELVHERKGIGAIRVLGQSLCQLERSADGRVAWMQISDIQLRRLGVDPEDTEGFVNYTRQIEGVQIGILFKGGLGGEVRVSIRSDSSYDVSKLAALFGGGGHPRAAGCTLRGPLGRARRRFLTGVFRWMQENPPAVEG